MAGLEVKHVSKVFGGLTAIQDVNIAFEDGELIGLIGPNGAGKTTLFNLITGVYEPTSGEIYLLEAEGHREKLNGRSPDAINRDGIARTFQNIRLFGELTVHENLLIALHAKHGASLMASLLRTPAYYSNERALDQRAKELLKIFQLDDLANEKAKNLPYGRQRILEIARAIATEPKIIFLDEPAAGMNPNETAELTALIQRLQQEFKVTLVLIEHDMSLVMEVCERLFVLEQGRLIASGTPEEIRQNQVVIDAYLGGA